MILDYVIITGMDPSKVAEQVATVIARSRKGPEPSVWQPYGPLIATHGPMDPSLYRVHTITYSQAMAKYSIPLTDTPIC